MSVCVCACVCVCVCVCVAKQEAAKRGREVVLMDLRPSVPQAAEPTVLEAQLCESILALLG